MKIPFTSEQFLENFRNYNHSVFPVQILFYVMALAIILLAVKRKSYTDKLISAFLMGFWLWMGVVYHYVFFSAINKAAYVFGSLFILQAILFFYFGILKSRLSFRFSSTINGITGSMLMLFALVVYPVAGFIQGHAYPSSPTFGLPCPTTIFTFGILLWSSVKIPIALLIIPLVWSFIGFSASFTLGIFEDAGLPVASIAATSLLMIHNRKIKTDTSKIK